MNRTWHCLAGSSAQTELTGESLHQQKNGHAPPHWKWRKSYQSVNPCCVWTWWVFSYWTGFSRRLHSWWCSSVNRFMFQACDHILTRTTKHWFLNWTRRGLGWDQDIKDPQSMPDGMGCHLPMKLREHNSELNHSGQSQSQPWLWQARSAERVSCQLKMSSRSLRSHPDTVELTARYDGACR